MSHQRSIMIGDYADISISGKLYRYHITKINADGITVAQINDPKQVLLLKSDRNNIWQIDKFTNSHLVTFNKNVSDTPYFERDLTQAPNKIIDVLKPFTFYGTDFTELKNGIIMYQFERNSGIFEFADPNEAKLIIPPVYKNYFPNTVSAPILVNPDKYEISNPFLEFKLYDWELYNDYRIINFVSDDDNSSELFIYTKYLNAIVKLNLNDLTFTEYDKNLQYTYVYPLKNRKILCLLQDPQMYILDTITNTKMDIVSAVWVNPLGYVEAPRIYQLSDGDIILNCLFKKPTREKYYNEMYRIRINKGKIELIKTFETRTNILGVLPDDNLLLWDVDSKVISYWGHSGYGIFDIFNLLFQSNATHFVSVVLINGDILFNIDRSFYLYGFKTHKVQELLLFIDKYTQKKIKAIRQLKNGNIIMINGDNLNIVEYPYADPRSVDKFNFDKISDALKLPPDMLALIRSYL